MYIVIDMYKTKCHSQAVHICHIQNDFKWGILTVLLPVILYLITTVMNEINEESEDDGVETSNAIEIVMEHSIQQ